MIQRLKNKVLRTSSSHEDSDLKNDHNHIPSDCQNVTPDHSSDVDSRGNSHELDEVSAKSESVSAQTEQKNDGEIQVPDVTANTISNESGNDR